MSFEGWQGPELGSVLQTTTSGASLLATTRAVAGIAESSSLARSIHGVANGASLNHFQKGSSSGIPNN